MKSVKTYTILVLALTLHSRGYFSFIMLNVCEVHHITCHVGTEGK